MLTFGCYFAAEPKAEIEDFFSAPAGLIERFCYNRFELTPYDIRSKFRNGRSVSWDNSALRLICLF